MHDTPPVPLLESGEGTDLYSVCFEDRTYDMPEDIDKRSKFIMIMKDALVQMSINIRK